MSTIITPSEEQINIVVNDEKISINVESGDVIVNVNEQIVEVSTVNGGYPLPTTVYSVFGRTGNIIAVDGDYDLGELGDVTLVSSTNGDVLTYDGTKWINKAVTGTGTVTSVNMSVPVGLQVSGNPITVAGTLAVNFAAGYSLPTTAKQTTWDAAYNDSIVSASVSGTTTKTLTLTQQDGGTITASWTDIDTNLVTSVNGYVGTVVLTTSDIAEGSRLYYTETRVSNNVDVAANTAARHSAVTIGTANGLSLASQVLSLALASASTTGALSSTDWATFNNKVPYSGATGNVTLGEYQLSAGQVAFDQSPTGTAGVGILRWNDSDGTLDLGLKGGNVTLQVGQEMVARVVNKTEADLLESGYKVVRISSAQGQRLAVQLAQANNDTNSTDTIGIVTETIANNQEGFITILGQVKEINTTGSLQGETWADGDVLYLSPTTAGNITNIKPVAPSHMVVVGYVEYAHSQHGKIYCKTQNGYELEELHNVLISSVANNEGLFYESATSLWKNKSIATVLGYTPISLTSLSGVSPLSYNNTTGAFSIAQATTSANGYLSSTDWNTFNGKQAALNGTGFVKATGTTISYDNSTYYLASNPSAYIALTGLSATAPLSYNNTTGGFTISQAGVSGNGYLSSTDWNTFNNKQAAGDYITALSGEATASGPGSAAVTLSTSAVTGKILTGVNITGGSISATDSILVAFGKVQNQINGVLGGAIYQSTWNASTNSPTLTSGTGTKGYYYIVSVAGSTNLDGITDWKIGDWAIFNGTTWNKVDNSDAVSSVNGFTGAVSLTSANISEVTNLYYTDVRVSANTDVAANTAARHAAVTLGTANGLSLSTQALSLGLASTSATGALSSTDWNTFNLKQAGSTNLTSLSALTYASASFVKMTASGTFALDTSVYYLASNPSGYTTNVGTVTSVAALTIGTSGTDLSSTVANSTTTPVITLNVPTASATNRGALSSADWTTFNNKQSALTNPVTGTGTTNYLPKFTGTSTIGNSIVNDNGTGIGIGIAAASPFILNTLSTDATTSGTIGIMQIGRASSGTAANGIGGNLQFTAQDTAGTQRTAAYITWKLAAASSASPQGYLSIGTRNASEALRIDDSGNLGLGGSPSTISTYRVLEVTGPNTSTGGMIRTNISDNSIIGKFYTNSTGVWLSAETSHPLILETANTERMRIWGSTGNVNIGTTPASDSGYKLDVNGTGRFSGDLTLSSGGDRIFSINDTGGNLFQIQAASNILYYSARGTGGSLAFRTNGTNDVKLSIASTGVATLNATDATYIVYQYLGTTKAFIGVAGATTDIISGAAAGDLAIRAQQKMQFATGGDIERMRITSAGATIMYNNMAVVDGQEIYDTQTYAANTGGTINFGGKYNSAGAYTLYARVSGRKENSTDGNTAGYLLFTTKENGGGATERMRITSGGNVGLGDSGSSNVRLQIKTGGNTSASYAIIVRNSSNSDLFFVKDDAATQFFSSVTATSFFESSDSRLKTLIQDNYQTKGIASITPKLYTKNGKVELGYYAQDFVGVLDSAVSKGSDDMLSLSYREVLVAKVYALEQEIKDLKAKMN